jgi:cyclophilin family peptidyl-prolyl cis-trans isomerase
MSGPRKKRGGPNPPQGKRRRGPSPGSYRKVGPPTAPVSRAGGPRLTSGSNLLRPGIAIVAVIVGVVLVGTVGLSVLRGTGAPSAAGPTLNVPVASTVGPIGPPSATPLANPPAQASGDGTKVTISTKLGDIVVEIYNRSAPVASQNFVNLAAAGFYNGTTFHRLVPGFVIQGGDPSGNGSGGPGYTIPDEPVVGAYKRGIVAMARTPQPNSQGSQFFIVLADSAAGALDAARTYVIFGNVVQGMDVVDKIAAMPNSGGQTNAAVNPVVMNLVTVQAP